MRIGLDVTSAVQQGGGIGRYTRELVRALAHADTRSHYRLFFASQHRPHVLPPLGPNFHVTALPFHDIWLARLWHRARAPLPVEWLTGPLDIFHSPDFTLPPTRQGTRTLLTVHDLTFLRDPASAAPGLLHYLTDVVPRSVARAQHVIAVSQATRTDLVELYNTPPEKISVIYEGVSDDFKPVADPVALAAVRAQYNLGDAPFILAVGTLQPRKNHARLIQAFSPIAIRHPSVHLVIAGGKGWLFDSIFAEVERFNLRDRVRSARSRHSSACLRAPSRSPRASASSPRLAKRCIE